MYTPVNLVLLYKVGCKFFPFRLDFLFKSEAKKKKKKKKKKGGGGGGGGEGGGGYLP